MPFFHEPFLSSVCHTRVNPLSSGKHLRHLFIALNSSHVSSIEHHVSCLVLFLSRVPPPTILSFPTTPTPTLAPLSARPCYKFIVCADICFISEEDFHFSLPRNERNNKKIASTKKRNAKKMKKKTKLEIEMKAAKLREVPVPSHRIHLFTSAQAHPALSMILMELSAK